MADYSNEVDRRIFILESVRDFGLFSVLLIPIFWFLTDRSVLAFLVVFFAVVEIYERVHHVLPLWSRASCSVFVYNFGSGSRLPLFIGGPAMLHVRAAGVCSNPAVAGNLRGLTCCTYYANFGAWAGFVKESMRHTPGPYFICLGRGDAIKPSMALFGGVTIGRVDWVQREGGVIQDLRMDETRIPVVSSGELRFEKWSMRDPGSPSPCPLCVCVVVDWSGTMDTEEYTGHGVAQVLLGFGMALSKVVIIRPVSGAWTGVEGEFSALIFMQEMYKMLAEVVCARTRAVAIAVHAPAPVEIAFAAGVVLAISEFDALVGSSAGSNGHERSDTLLSVYGRDKYLCLGDGDKRE